jgi:uncharacterized protein (TIGR02594 family)
MNVRDIQAALQAAGFNPGPVDGVRGRQTIAAIKAFQASNGLTADGIIGPQTAGKLFRDRVPAVSQFEIPATTPWLQTAFELMGTREKPGKGSNEAIIGWARDLEIVSYNDDDIPWCGLFVAHCVGSQLPEESLPNNPLGARAWERFGHKTTPQLGAVMVFWRGSKTSGLGHVGFYWAEDDEAYHILGGNQSNAVTVTRLARSRFLQARWPATVPAPTGITRASDTQGKLLSQNEA